MMKRSSRHACRDECKRRGRRGRPAKKTPKPAGEQHTHEHTVSGSGRISAEFCRLCHGKFSTRRLRQAFAELRGESCGVYPLFCTDFQLLLGVPMNRDPGLSQFICNKCHAQFYKCHSILLDFRNRVNLSPFSRDSNSAKCLSSKEDITLSLPHITSDTKCLHGLVSWAHNHAEGCHSCPDLKEVLEGQYQGSLKVMWGCVDGHSYIMDSSVSQSGSNMGQKISEPASEEGSVRKSNNENHQSASRPDSSSSTSRASKAATPQTHSSTQSSITGLSDMQGIETSSPVPTQLMDRDGDSDLSDRNFLSDDEFEDKRKSGSSEESTDLYPEKCSSKRNNTVPKTVEPKARRKPGPKPGWKKKIKSEREELPTIYKCPHQGCTAVYRGADGMKKHIKEHHEEVRERPCPHPGCNKVFMIDRYLQRHVKLIHTEVRNYICDQCGQTFKQRKHLSVHQMRHSGAKPLQCEVCGFQCRQRASLKYHMTKHKAEADLEFACAICGKRFEKAHNLNVHMSMVHPLMQGGSIAGPHDPEPQNPSATGPLTQQADQSGDQPRTASNTPDMQYVLENIQSKLIDRTM